MRTESLNPAHKRALRQDGAPPRAKYARAASGAGPPQKPQPLPHLPDELWLAILSQAQLTPPELARLRQVDCRWGRLACDDTLWRGFVPAQRAADGRSAYAAFVQHHAQLPWADQRVVGELWHQRGRMDLLARHPDHFGVAQACAHRQGRSLRRMSEALRDDAHLVDTALTNAPAAFECASARLRADFQRLSRAVAAEPSLWRLVPHALQQTPDFICDWARRLMQRNSFGPALDACVDVLEKFKAHPIAHAHLVACHFELGALDQARQAFAVARRLIPNFAQHHPELVFVCAPEPDDAALHQAVLALWPRLHDLQLQAALERADAIWPDLLTPEDVQGFCMGPYRLTTRLTQVLGVLADRQAQQGDMAGATALFERALLMTPENKCLRLTYAFRLLEVGHVLAARDQLTPLMRETPDMLGAWTGLALCELADGHKARAKAAIHRGVTRALGSAEQGSFVCMGLIAGLVGSSRHVASMALPRQMLARMPCRERMYRAMAGAMQGHGLRHEVQAVLAAAQVWADLHQGALP